MKRFKTPLAIIGAAYVAVVALLWWFLGDSYWGESWG